MSKTLDINVQEPYFSYIDKKIKTIEGRLGKDKFKSLQSGDKVKINNEIDREVNAVLSYPTFRAMLEAEGYRHVIPDASSIDEAVNAYYKFYTQEDEEKLGVVAILMK